MEAEEFDKIVKKLSEPKYGGIDAFFAALTFLVVGTIIPVTVKAWQWAF